MALEGSKVYIKNTKDYILHLVDNWSTDHQNFHSIEHNQYCNHELSIRKEFLKYVKRTVEVLKVSRQIIKNSSKLINFSSELLSRIIELNFGVMINSQKSDNLINKCLIVIVIHSFEEENWGDVVNNFMEEFPNFFGLNDRDFAMRYKE